MYKIVISYINNNNILVVYDDQINIKYLNI